LNFNSETQDGALGISLACWISISTGLFASNTFFPVKSQKATHPRE
jgi:hypothetical protein